MMARPLFLTMLAIAVYCSINGAIALKCYAQPSAERKVFEDTYKQNKDPEELRKLVQEAMNIRTEMVCNASLYQTACLFATKCEMIGMQLLGVEIFDYRDCAASNEIYDLCKEPHHFFGGNSLGEICQGECGYCQTDLCNDGGGNNVVINKKKKSEETTTASSDNGKEGGDGNGGSRGWSPIPLLLVGIGTIISMVDGIRTLVKM